MKKITIVLLVSLFSNVFSQSQDHYCGFDEEMKKWT